MIAEQVATSTKRSGRWSKVCHRSQTTNDPLALPNVDHRSTWGRRRRDLIRALSDEVLQRRRALTTADRLLIAQCAAIQTRAEQLQVQIAQGDMHVDDEQLTRFAGIVTRMLESLGVMKPLPTPTTMDTDVTPMSAHQKGDDHG